MPSSAVRFVLLLGLIFLSLTALRGDETSVEKERIDQILKPDQARKNPMQPKAFYGGKNFNQSRNANTKSFYFGEKLTPQNSQKTAFTRDFFGAKSFAGSDVSVSTKSAPTRGHWLSRLSHVFGSKKAETREAWDAGKTFRSNASIETSEYRGPERGKVNQTMPNTDKKMSIGDVRELLNRNK